MGLLLFVGILLVAAEFGARWYLADRIEKQVAPELGAPVDASFGTTPVLLGLATDRSVDTVHLTSPGAEKVPRLDVTGHHARLQDGAVAVDSADGTALLSDAQLTAAAAEGGDSSSPLGAVAAIRSVRSDPGAGVLRADVGGLAQVGVSPGVSGGKLTLTPENAEVMGVPLPDGLFGGIGGTVDSALESLPEGVTLDGAKVVHGGLEAHLSGKDLLLRKR